jgi:hydroxymethylglutaryl-CoA lyase
MAGAEEVVAAVGPCPGVIRAGLALNERGYDRLLASGLDECDSHSASRRRSTSAIRARVSTSRWRRHAGSPRALAGTGSGARSRSASRSDARSRARSTRPRRCDSRAGRRGRAGRDRPCRHDRGREPARGHVADRAGRRARTPVGGHFHNTRNTGYANALALSRAARRSSTRRSRASEGARSHRMRPEHRDRGPRVPPRAGGVATGSTSID